MSRPITVEQRLLSKPEKLCDELSRANGAPDHTIRLEVLEAAATRISATSLEAYREAFECEYRIPLAEAKKRGEKIAGLLAQVQVPPPLALSALARPPLEFSEQRSTGAFHTDFRLATLLADMAADALQSARKIVDPACGSGILLVAAVMKACGSDPERCAEFVGQRVVGADLSESALRGTRLALASLCSDTTAVVDLNQRLRAWDSLLTSRADWESLAPQGFDVVIANPPWEKVKLSRHEFLRAQGAARHYGDVYDDNAGDLFEFIGAVDSVSAYGAKLSERYRLLGPGENDLYKPFLELFTNLLHDRGCLSVLVPAGLIRSNGTQPLRELLFKKSVELEFAISENRSNFFSIDSRFKFLAIRAALGDGTSTGLPVVIKHLGGADTTAPAGISKAAIDRKTLIALRPDLTIPEVRTPEEWRLFEHLYRHGVRLDVAAEWRASVARELDMTRDRSLFVDSTRTGALPVVEGRMVHQHRFGAKKYISGTGRRAVWEWVESAKTEIEPQFWVPETKLPDSVRQRTRKLRVGFCDITGQTNERSMLGALIPNGVVCGNKVPTLIFADDSLERMLLWLGIVNSFTFDWLLRRVVTTTVNYFLLFSLPFPKIELQSPLAQRIVTAVRTLQDVRALAGASHWERMWQIGQVRADIDACVAHAYELGYEEVELLLTDFPLLDRSQPALFGDERSTVTRDVLLHACAQLEGRSPDAKIVNRVIEAREIRALPYIPSEAADDLFPQSEAQVGESSWSGRGRSRGVQGDCPW